MAMKKALLLAVLLIISSCAAPIQVIIRPDEKLEKIARLLL
jgi:hypothetical protein